MAEAAANDDLSILSTTVVLRCIPATAPNRWVVADERLGDVRPSTQAFKDNRNGPMSVFIEDECGGAAAIVNDLPGFAVVALTVGLLRECGLGIVRDPEHGGPGHCLVVGSKTDPARNRLAREGVWVIRPPDS